MIPVGPDVTLYAPTEDLTDTLAAAEDLADAAQTALLGNPLRRRKLPTLEHPALDLYAGYSDFLVKTALIRSEKWKNTLGPEVSSGAKAAELTRHLAFADVEHLIVLALNNQNRLMAIHETAIGSTSRLDIETKQALKVPILVGATSVILVHNHPGGDATPSPQDIELTTTLLAAYKCVGINLLDHVIVTTYGHWSFYEHDLIFT